MQRLQVALSDVPSGIPAAFPTENDGYVPDRRCYVGFEADRQECCDGQFPYRCVSVSTVIATLNKCRITKYFVALQSFPQRTVWIR